VQKSDTRARKNAVS